jgi:dTDP-4-amino-4,6-dideoxygalactose transaminase
MGDAGLIVTNDAHLAGKARQIREYGWARRYVSDIVGRNSRLDELQAAVLRVKLRHLDDDNDQRRYLAMAYANGLMGDRIKLPVIRPHADHVFHLFVVRTPMRDSLVAHLRSQDIQAGIHYPFPVHLQPAYKGRIRCASSMNVTEDLAQNVLSLPLYPELTLTQVARVVEVLSGDYIA